MRVPKERLEALGEYELLRGGLIVDNSVLKHAKPDNAGNASATQESGTLGEGKFRPASCLFQAGVFSFSVIQ